MNKKSQLNQVFIYLASIILVLFVGFLVSKFVFTFSGDTQSRAESKIYDTLEKDFITVYRTYGSEKVLEYRIPTNVKSICFVKKQSCINSLDILDNISSSSKEELNLTVEGGDNVAVFDDSGILSSYYIGDFNVKGDGCFCVRPKNNRFGLVIENLKNIVYIEEN